MNRTTGALARAMLAGVTAVMLMSPPAHGQTTLPALTCFNTADRATPHGRFVSTTTTRAGQETCIFKTPAKLACVSAGPVSVTPSPTGSTEGTAPGDLVCYQARCIHRVQTGADVTDPFGTRSVSFQRARYVCVAAGATAATTTTTVPGAGTTTTTIQTSGCRFANGQCTGSCGAGMRCGAAVGTASCACRSVSCGDADAPTCNGACTSPGDACVFTLTGCSCVRIP
jgi:hypothetical protein